MRPTSRQLRPAPAAAHIRALYAAAASIVPSMKTGPATRLPALHPLTQNKEVSMSLLTRTLSIAASALLAGSLAVAPAQADVVEISPPGANDWSCTPTAEHPYPVVLVPGTFESMVKNWSTLSPYLKSQGYCVFALNYGETNGVYATAPVADSAKELAPFVDAVLAATGARKVNLVGHSQGGMMPRYYMGFLGGAKNVNQLIGIAPSNHGTEEAHVVAGHHAALAVAHQVHLPGAGGSQDRVNERGEFLGGVRDGCRGVDAVRLAVVQGKHAVALALEVGREGGPVLHHALERAGHQDHRIGVFGSWRAGPVIRAGRGNFDDGRLGGCHGQGSGQEGRGGDGQGSGEQRH